jgi:hypothetical protein
MPSLTLAGILHDAWRRDFVRNTDRRWVRVMEYTFLYACRRDFVRNRLRIRLLNSRELFLYACRRDFVWNPAIGQEIIDFFMQFLYACRRDFVWNPCTHGWKMP